MQVKHIVLYCLFLFLGSAQVVRADLVPVQLPLTIDLVQLRAMVVAQAYPLAGEQAKVVDYAGGCDRITLSQPTLEVEGIIFGFLPGWIYIGGHRFLSPVWLRFPGRGMWSCCRRRS